MYDSRDELLHEIHAGEDSYLEFKEVVFKGNQLRLAGEEGKAPEALAKVLTCFANTDGGVVIFGVTDGGEIVALPFSPEDATGRSSTASCPTQHVVSDPGENGRAEIVGVEQSKIELLEQLVVNVSQNNCDPPLPILLDKIELPGVDGSDRLCLKVEVTRAQFHVHRTTGGHWYHRVGSHCYDMSGDQLARLMARREMLIPFEERPWLRAPLDALDRSLFAAYYERRYGHPLAQSEIPYERLAQNLKLVVADETNTPRPTVLGLLLFCHDPHTYLGRAFVDVAAYTSEHPDANHQRDAKKITGTVPEQIEKCVEYLRVSPFVPVAASKNEMGRKDQPAYSLRALQEAVVNALVHRDYQLTGSQVRIFLFPNRIEISSPGALHNTIRPEDLYAGCQPYRRNQLLAGFLRDYESPLTGRAYMEARGEGFLMMVRESERVSGRRPDLQVIGDSVRLTIYAGGQNR